MNGAARLSTLAVLALVLIGSALDRAGWLPTEASLMIQRVYSELFGPPLPPVAGAERVDFAAVDAALARIKVARERDANYNRSEWPHWQDVEGCLNVREAVLIRDSAELTRRSRDRCRIIAGKWPDPYSGKVLTDPEDIDVDHVVPLEEAHQSGGYAWDRDRRAAYANDLSDWRTLRAVSAEQNRSKGAKGPEEWLPDNPAHRCPYVADWVLIKARWGLTMDESERVAVGNILEACRRTLPGQAPERRPLS